jgi:CBS domain-containing protein
LLQAHSPAREVLEPKPKETIMNVSQLMSQSVETCRPEDSLAFAAGKMWDRDVGCLPVVAADGRVVGIVTDRDVCMAGYTQGRPLADLPVSVAMSKELYSCRASDALIEAEETMRSHQVRRLAVVDANGRLAGLISLNDLAREAEREIGRKGRELTAQEVSATLAAVCTPRGARALAATA